MRWAIVLREQENRVIGSCGYYNLNEANRSVEIGYDLHPAHWRQGIMTEALRAAINYGFSNKFPFWLNRIEALTYVEHEASAGLLRKLGFQEEGIRREYGHFRILVLFMRRYPKRKAVFFAAFLFAVIHLNPLTLDLHEVVDVISIFFMGLLFTYLALKTGSLLLGIIFHYLHDVFLFLVQNTPGAGETLAATLLYAFLWIALVIGAGLTKTIVERWPAKGSRTLGSQA